MGDERAVVLSAAAEAQRIARRYVDVVIHRATEPDAAVLPVKSAIIAHVHAAIVRVVNAAGRRRRHEQRVMIGMRVIRLAAFGIPERDLLPFAPAISR